MKRKDFCRYFFYLSGGMIATSFPSLSLALNNSTHKKYLSLSSSITNQNTLSNANLSTSFLKSYYRWVIVYWMPYDNDLERFGESIIQILIESTINNPDVLVVVQSDYLHDTKMRRRLIFDGKVKEVEVTEENSSDSVALANYLDWVKQSCSAKYFGFIIVGHGGKLNEIIPDYQGPLMRNRTWMGVEQLSEVVSHFNQSTDGKVEFLFLQNCHKATLEVIYQVRNCAKYTLASQFLLGVPNYYYKGFFDALKQPSINGREVAIAIMDSEQSDMYHTLTLVDNQAVKDLPKNLLPFIKIIVNHSFLAVNMNKLLTYSYRNEKYCDILVFLNYLATISHSGKQQLSKFIDFL